jgi:hypothetical protein
MEAGDQFPSSGGKPGFLLELAPSRVLQVDVAKLNSTSWQFEK